MVTQPDRRDPTVKQSLDQSQNINLSILTEVKSPCSFWVSIYEKSQFSPEYLMQLDQGEEVLQVVAENGFNAAENIMFTDTKRKVSYFFLPKPDTVGQNPQWTAGCSETLERLNISSVGFYFGPEHYCKDDGKALTLLEEMLANLLSREQVDEIFVFKGTHQYNELLDLFTRIKSNTRLKKGQIIICH